MISIVIPTFNETRLHFYRLSLERLSAIDGVELIVADAGSSDNTLELAERFGAKILPDLGNSRAKRLNAGIEAATHQLILLHHPRSLLEPAGVIHLRDFADYYQWGGFSHAFDCRHPLLKFTSWYSNHVRGKLRGIYYLDHCIFFKRSLLDRLPVIPEVDIFEDTRLSEKLLKIAPHPSLLPYTSVTSAIRFERNGVFFQAAMNQLLKACYLLNFSDKTMNRIYEKGLELNSSYKLR